MENYKIIGWSKLSYVFGLFLAWAILPISLVAQGEDFQRDSIQAEQWLEASVQWREREMLDSANVQAKKSAQLFANLKLWDKWYDSQYEVCNNLLTSGKYDDLINYLEQAADSLLPQANDPVLSAKINAWLGYVYHRQGIYNKALDYYLIEAKILEDAGNPGGKHGDFSNISVYYIMQGDYDQALVYLEKAESIQMANQDTRGLINTYWNMGKAHWANNNFYKAIESYQNCLKFGGDDSELFMTMGEVYRDMGELDKAMTFAEKALKGFRQQGIEVGGVYVLIGSVYWLKNDLDRADQKFQKALSILKESEGDARREIGKLYISIGGVNTQTGNYSLALSHYQKAISIFIPSFKEQDARFNPSLETMDLAYGIWVMEALVAKGHVFEKQYAIEHKSEYLQQALSCYKSAFKSIDILRYHQTEEASKIGLIKYAHPIFEQAIGATMALYKIAKEEKYLNQAFAFSQRTKAFLLASALQNINARKQGGVPDSLIQKERDLKAAELTLNQDILGLKNQLNDPVDSLKLLSLKDQRFEVKRKLQKLLAHLEQNYPQYYQLKYEDKVASINDIREHVLDQHTALIDYFLGDSSLFVLTITKDKVDLQELDRTKKLDNALADFIFQVGNSDFLAGANSAYQQFTESAYFIFQQLLEKPLVSAGQNINQVLIIPDGILNNVPFEALLTSLEEGSQINYSMSNLSYLMEGYVISYHYAPQVLLAQKKKIQDKTAPKLFAGFAPDFSANKLMAQVRDCSELGLSNLAYNQMEVENISLQIDGESFLSTDASVDVFKAIAKDYRILHLATHACMSEDDPLKHKIFFTNDEYLSASELFNLPLNAEMVVLSACETGIGKFVKGEGVMSLARGFSYTGCPSVMMSLWSVPDKASADIMIQFYENLKEGLPKDQALRNAKLNFIKSQKSLHHHPYYWAAIVPIGDTGAISLNIGLPGWIWFAGLGSLLLIGFIFLLKFRVAS